MPVTLERPWTAPSGITFPMGTYFVHSAAWGIWDIRTPDGSWNTIQLDGIRPGEEK